MKIFLRFFTATILTITFGFAQAAVIIKEQDYKSKESIQENLLTRMDLFNTQMKEFNLLDLDNDGLLTKQELEKVGFPQESIYGLFTLLDEDNSLSIKKSEVLYRISKEFDAIDDNKDGSLSIEEIKKYPISVVPVIVEEDMFYKFDEPLIYQEYKNKEHHMCPYHKKHHKEHHHKCGMNHKKQKCEAN